LPSSSGAIRRRPAAVECSSSGDDGTAKAAVAELFDAAGFFPIDLGDLASGGRLQQAAGPLAGLNLVRLP
jgi:predicted dinucleotide-binding enzyme